MQILVGLSLTGLIISYFGHSFAEDNSANLWAPSDMITGEDYEGVVILYAGARYGQIMMLSTNDPTVIKIPESVTILPYSNHGIFPIKAVKGGTATIFAVTDGRIIQENAKKPDSSQLSRRSK